MANKNKRMKQYPVHQSPLFKLRNHKKLADVLGTKPQTLKKVVKRGDKNYKFGTTESGRAIEIPQSQILRYHNRINQLLSRISPPDYLMSGVKGRSYVGNAVEHQGERAVAKQDIKAFYQSTTKEIVYRGLRKRLQCSSDIAETLAELCTVKGHIPTGSPISQSLAFFVNFGVFEHINQYASSRGLRFTLYVDDLTFSGKEIPKNFLRYISSYLEKNRGYKVHKHRTYRATTEKEVTGVILKQGGVDVKNKHRQKIHSMLTRLSYFSDVSPKDDAKTRDYFQRLIGHLFSAGQISPGYRTRGKEIVEIRKSIGVEGRNQNGK